MGKLPYGVLDVNDDSIVLSKEYIEHYLQTCKTASKRSKELGDEEAFSYFKGRAGVFEALLHNWQYVEKKEEN